jgi:hypothetical protein
MKRQSLRLSGWCVVLFATAVQAQAPAPASTPNSPDAVLKERKLERRGATFVVESEAAALEKVSELKSAFAHWTSAQEKVAAIDQNNQAITALTNQAAYLNQEKQAIGAQARNMPRLPRGGGFIRQGINQQINAAQQQEQMAINEVNAEIAARKKQVPSQQARKEMEDNVTKAHDEAVEAATAARKIVDEANTAYDALGKDAAVKAALAEVKKTTTDAIKLGPSKDFHAAVATLEKAERLLHINKPAAEETTKHHKPAVKPRPRKPTSTTGQPQG